MSRRVIAAVIGVFLLVQACAGLAVFGIVGSFRQAIDELEESSDNITAAAAVDDVFERVWDRIETRDAMWERAEHSGVDMATLVRFTVDDIEEIRTQVTRARRLAADIPEPEVREAYLAVCDELDAEFSDPSAGVEDTKPFSDAYATIEYALRIHEPVARRYLGDAMQAYAEGRYADAYQAATTANAEYWEVHLAYRQAADTSGVAGVLVACEYLETLMQRSTVEQDLAMLGDVGSVNAYADYNKRSTELGALADSQESLIDDAYDALFAEAAAVFPPIGTRAAKAKQLWDDAQKLAEDPGAALRD